MVSIAVTLIGIDWGSSGLRVFLIDAEGRLIDSRAAEQGASTLSGSAAAYAQALDALAGDWLRAWPQAPLLACGMVGSQHGWHEVPYARCPADASALAAQAVAVPAAVDGRLRIVPGLLHDPHGAAPDVMRGEETQIVGALHLHPHLNARCCIVLPGTHSKWAQVVAGRVQSFATHLTGELFALLRQHSVLGRLMPAATVTDASAFADGVAAALAGTDLSHQLFAVRTLGLLQRLPTSALADYLSGLLIGHEVGAGLAWRAAAGLADAPLVLVGEAPLCARYAQALQQMNLRPDAVLPNTAPAGLWRIAMAAEPALTR